MFQKSVKLIERFFKLTLRNQIVVILGLRKLNENVKLLSRFMKPRFFSLVLSVFFCLTFWSDASAKCQRVATVKYQQQFGWSKKYTVEVNFMSGYELNQATKSFDYTTLSVYAIIFWGEGQATVIKLSSILACGMEVTCSCIDNALLDLKGVDQDGDQWNICLSNYCL